MTGFTTGGTGTSLYEVGSGLDSTQRIGVNSAALGNISIIAGGSGNTASGYVSVISGGILNTSLGNSSVIGGGSCNTSGINGIVDSIYNQTFTGNTPFGGSYGSFSPSSTLSGLGTGSTFSFYFSSPTTLSNAYVNQSGLGYVSGDTLTFNGSLFGGAAPQDNVTLQINTTNGGNNIAIGGGCRNTAYRNASTIGGGCFNKSNANCSTIGGGCCNIINIDSCYSTISGGRGNTTYGCYSTISGGRNNEGGVINGVSGVYNQVYTGGTLNGLFTNVSPTSTNSLYGFDATFNFQFFLGSLNNITVNNRGNFYESNDLFFFDGSVFGGTSGVDDVTFNVNTTTNNYATIAGGCRNTGSGEYSTISGGYENTTSADYSTIAGGANNTISTFSEYATIGGGDDNTIIGSEVATIAGGENNTITTNSDYSFIGGGFDNVVKSAYSSIVGGCNNTASGYNSFVGGGKNNVSGINNFVSGINSFTYTGGTLNLSYGGVVPTSTSSGTGSGSYFSFDFVLGVLQTVQIQNGGSGYSNGETLYFNGGLFGGSSPLDDVWLIIQTQNNSHTTVSGGYCNTSIGNRSTISGGYCNFLNSPFSTIGGGCQNSNSPSAKGSTIAGGVGNCMGSFYVSIGGGCANTSSGYYSTVSGGRENTSSGIDSIVSGGYLNTSTGPSSTINGGRSNAVDNQYDTIGGGANNTTILSGGATGAATISGGYQNTSGNYYTFNGGGCNNKTLGEFSSIVGGQNNQNISGLVQQVSFNSGNASAIPDNTYSVYPTNNGGYGSGLQISFDVNTGVVSNANVVSTGIRYEQGQQVLVSGDTIGGSSPANDLTFNLDSVIESHYSFIGGGQNNTSSGRYSTISGGQNNTSSGYCSTVSGGYRNTSSCYSSTVSGGYRNTSSGGYSTVSGGYNNTSSGQHSIIGGGRANISSEACSVVNGGEANNAGGCHSFIGGGFQNVSGINGYVTNVTGFVYTGGTFNSTFTGVAPTSTVSGKGSNASFNFSFLGGVLQSVIIQFAGSGYVNGDTLYFNGNSFAGGSSPVDDVWITIQSTSDSFTTVVGGSQNTSSGYLSIVGAGYQNTSSGCYSIIGGGWCNTTVGDCSMILGGYANKSIGTRSAVVGGQSIIATENDMVYMPNANIQSSGYIYFGDVNTNGSWRMRISGATFIIEKRVGGVWVTSGTFV